MSTPPPLPPNSRPSTTPPPLPPVASSAPVEGLPTAFYVDIPITVSAVPVTIESSRGDVHYTLNLKHASCTCPDFQKRRNGYSRHDPRRYCKHLANAVVSAPDYSLSENAQLTMAYPPSQFIDECALSTGVKFYLLHDGPESEWVNVHARKRKAGEKAGWFSGKYDRYGYNRDERRWSYGEGPAGAGEIREAIAELLDAPSAPHPLKGSPTAESRGCFYGIVLCLLIFGIILCLTLL